MNARTLAVSLLPVAVLCGCEEKPPPEAPKAAPTIYRYRSKDGVLHFTDDKDSIPKGAKIEETSGAEIKVVAAVKIDAGPQLVGTEYDWRARFREKKRLIDQLQELVDADAKVVGGGENNEMIQEAMANDVAWTAALMRLRNNRKELERQKAALTNLHEVADTANVPKAWRE